MEKRTVTPNRKLFINKTKTFQCVDCGIKYPLSFASKKIDTYNTKYCKYCMC